MAASNRFGIVPIAPTGAILLKRLLGDFRRDPRHRKET